MDLEHPQSRRTGSEILEDAGPRYFRGVVLMTADPLDDVLRLVAEGRLTAEEAAPILAAWDERVPGAPPAGPDAPTGAGSEPPGGFGSNPPPGSVSPAPRPGTGATAPAPCASRSPTPDGRS